MPAPGVRLGQGLAAPCSELAVGQGHKHLSLARVGDLGPSGAKAMPKEGRGRRGHPRAEQVHSCQPEEGGCRHSAASISFLSQEAP